MNLRHAFRLFIGKYPVLYFPLYTLKAKNKRLAVDANTELVIEGFPRSANTFAVAAFESHDVDIDIAHHMHVPAQIIRGVKLNKPCVLLIREPKAAISSMLIRHPEIPAEQAIASYIAFYQPLKLYKADVVVAKFDEVTTDYGAVIERVNQRFSISLPVFEHSKEFEARAFRYMENLKEDLEQGNSEHRVARPSQEREKLKPQIEALFAQPKCVALLERATALYTFFTS